MAEFLTVKKCPKCGGTLMREIKMPRVSCKSCSWATSEYFYILNFVSRNMCMC